MINVKLRCFGAIRKYEPIGFHSETPLTLRQVKERVSMLIPDEAELIADCALADESRVLAPDHVVNSSCTLLLLPPVCGG